MSRLQCGAQHVTLAVDLSDLPVPSLNQVRRVASGGLKLVSETSSREQEILTLTEADANATVADLISAHTTMIDQPDTRTYLKCGRHLIELS